MKREFQRRSLKFSLALHGGVLFLMLVLPWLTKGCASKRPNEKLMFVEFTVSIPPPPAPEITKPEMTKPEVEPPKPEPEDTIKMPDKKPTPPKPEVKPEPPKPEPKPPKSSRQTNRVIRRAPTPIDKPPSDAEIARLLAQGARISNKTSIPPPEQQLQGAYLNHVHDRMYAVWQQPTQLKNLPGLRTSVEITIAPDGRILKRVKVAGSGNALMDESVMKAVTMVQALRALPAGHKKPVDVTIDFELSE